MLVLKKGLACTKFNSNVKDVLMLPFISNSNVKSIVEYVYIGVTVFYWLRSQVIVQLGIHILPNNFKS